METLDPFLFIHIGLCIRALLQCKEGFIHNFVIEEGKKLTENLAIAGFQVSSVGVLSLTEFTDKIKLQPEAVLTFQEVTELSTIMVSIEKMVYAEASTKNIFIVNGGRYSLEVLMQNPEKMFPSGVFSSLPELARYDLIEGFLCLIFSRATATAFHLLRATEAVLKELYITNIKRNREKNLMWGNMVNALRKRKNMNQGLLDRLDYIRLSYRNPTDHPDAIFSINDAENLLGLCVEVIGEMSKLLKK